MSNYLLNILVLNVFIGILWCWIVVIYFNLRKSWHRYGCFLYAVSYVGLFICNLNSATSMPLRLHCYLLQLAAGICFIYNFYHSTVLPETDNTLINNKMNKLNFFASVWSAVTSLFNHAEDEAKLISKVADAIVNEIKVLQGNALVQFLEIGLITVVETINPKLTPLIAGLQLALPKALNAVSGIDAEVNKTPLQQADDLTKYLANLKSVSGTLYAGALVGINAQVQQYFAQNSGIIASNEQVLTSAIVQHASVN